MNAAVPERTFETYSPPEFRERVAALVGGTTFREPGCSHAQLGQIPTAQAVAATLALARRGAADIGPDLALDIATRRPAHYQRVCEWLGREFARDRGAAWRRTRAAHGWLAVLCYRAVVLDERFPPCPDGMSQGDYETVALSGVVVLMNEADSCLAEAARRWRRR